MTSPTATTTTPTNNNYGAIDTTGSNTRIEDNGVNTEEATTMLLLNDGGHNYYGGKRNSATNSCCHGRFLYLVMGGILIMGGLFAYQYNNSSNNNNNNNSSNWKSFLPRTSNNNHQQQQPPPLPSNDTATTEEHFYHHQLIDHLNPSKPYHINSNNNTKGRRRTSTTYTQRYYESAQYFGGPGSPIFVIMGGEDPLDGLLYPLVYNHLAQTYHGYTVALEHRFFGKSMPLDSFDSSTDSDTDTTNTVFPNHDDLHQLLSPNQAVLDAVQFIQYKRQELGCHLHRGHAEYCPVISVGGSYPGFLAALLRLVHPDIVDIGYGSSAPFHLYSHHTDQYAYYDKVTATAETASPGCADAVRTTMREANEDIVESLDEQLHDVGVTYGICRGSIPSYIQTTALLAQELMLIITTHFANGNMNYYPPTPQQDLVIGCSIFQNLNGQYKSTEDKIKGYLLMGDNSNSNSSSSSDAVAMDRCFDMMTELPPGPNGTISSSDWSGVGAGPEGYYWDYISCQLIPMCGFSDESMFVPREWNYTWVIQHCMNRFDHYPDLWSLQEEFQFDDLSNVSRLLLTNGIVDGWSIASVLQENLFAAPGVRVINMVNGAHHSDLSHVGPTPNDTPDVKDAFLQITALIGDWLDEIRTENTVD